MLERRITHDTIIFLINKKSASPRKEEAMIISIIKLITEVISLISTMIKLLSSVKKNKKK